MSSRRTQGNLIIVSAPSGAGKTTLCARVVKELDNIVSSISYTTRTRRSAEKNGVAYHFITQEAFNEMIARKRFAEWAIVHGHHYGTDRKFIEGTTEQGMDVILNIDIQGAEQLIKKYPNAVSIFIHTPSFEELKKRLIERKSDSQTSIEKRLREAERELKASSSYQYQIVNDEIERASQELISIIKSERQKS